MQQAKDAALRLVGEPLLGSKPRLEALICTTFEALRACRPHAFSDLAAASAQLNMLHRIGTLAALHRMTPDVFVSEYGFDRHIDPYDSIAYRGNLYLDFGSTRGVDPFYPRTVDLILSEKRFIGIRFLDLNDRLADYLARSDANGFLMQCERHAADILAMHRHGPT